MGGLLDKGVLTGGVEGNNASKWTATATAVSGSIGINNHVFGPGGSVGNVSTAVGAGTIPAATSSAAGVMTAADKSKLDGIAAGANKYTLPTATKGTLGGVRLGSDTAQTVAAAAVTATAGRTYAVQKNSAGEMVVNVPWTNTTYTVVTTSANGLMSTAMLTKLNGIATGATADGALTTAEIDAAIAAAG